MDDGNRHAFNNAALTGLFLDFEAGRSTDQYDEQACLTVPRQGLQRVLIHGQIALRAEELAKAKKALDYVSMPAFRKATSRSALRESHGPDLSTQSR